MRYGVDMVPLQAVAAVTAGLGTAGAVKAGGGPSSRAVRSSARDVAAEMGHGAR